MKNNSLIIFCFFMNLSVVMGQSYPSLISKANNEYQAKAFKESYRDYELAFKIKKTNSTDLYNAGCSAALAGHVDRAVVLINDAIKNGWLDIEHLKKDTDLDTLRKLKSYAQILKNFEQLARHVQDGYDQPLKQRLEKIFKDDQDSRNEYISLTKKYGSKSPKVDFVGRRILHTDSLNVTLVTHILDSTGWVGQKKVGMKASQALFLVIQHGDLAIQKKYLPMMKAAVMKEEASPSWLALLEDRIAIKENRKQIYGSQIGNNKETGEYYVLPLEDPEHVDLRREQVGLGPLSEYVKQWNIHWNPSLQSKDQKNE